MTSLGTHQNSPMFRLRSQFGLSQTRFASLIGLSVIAVRNAERRGTAISNQTKKVVGLLIKVAELEEQLEKAVGQADEN